MRKSLNSSSCQLYTVAEGPELCDVSDSPSHSSGHISHLAFSHTTESGRVSSDC